MQTLNVDYAGALVTNRLMPNGRARRRQLNFFLPDEIVTAFEKMSGPKKGKQKWLFGSAAILLLLGESDETLDTLKAAVGAADATNDFDALVERIQKNRHKDGGRYGKFLGLSKPSRD
jgi:hypothetical protein